MGLVPETSQSPTPSVGSPESGASQPSGSVPPTATSRRFSFSRLKRPSNPVTIFPQPRRFAVVQMDPITMLTTAGLDDPEALAVAKALMPKKYMVYLESVSPRLR